MGSRIHYYAHEVASRLTDDAHHVGLAILPFLLSKEFALAVLALGVVAILLLMQAIVTAPAIAAAAIMPAEPPEGSEDTP